MLRINRDAKNFSFLETPKLADVSITERYDLQEFIANSPDAFFKELGLELFLIGKEIEPSEDVQDRIDLLAVDKEGCSVVVELKRGNNKYQMLQAISYAAMISKWDSDEFIKLLDENQQEKLTDFLDVDRDDINRRQKIVLIAEGYDYALLISAEWLSEQYGIDIICCRLAVAKDVETDSEYLVCSNVFPAPELAKESVARGRGHANVTKLKWTNWESALSSVVNQNLVSYFKKELNAEIESYLKKRILIYRIEEKRRWFITARTKNAYVWQQGRFDNDIEFWKKGLSDQNVVKSVKNNKCLRLFLQTSEDFQFFHDSVTKTLLPVKWYGGFSDDGMDDGDLAGEE